MGWRGKERNVYTLPEEIEPLVEKSEDRPTVRRSIRRAIADLFSSDFDERDLKEMRQGRAPYAHEDQQIDSFTKIQLHHKVPRHKHQSQTLANRLANLIGLSPLYHDSDFVDDEYHRGSYYGKKKKEERQKKEDRKRSSIR